MRRLALIALLLGACDLGTYNATGGDSGTVLPGVDGSVTSGPDGGVVARYHPANYALPTVHGPELKLQVQDCRGCHGASLEGVGTAVSCDGCHSAPPAAPTAWRTQCTFCHGGTNDMTGAPPRNLDGTAINATGTFPAHGKHVAQGISAASDCTQCHVKATDVLSPGHIFDSTKGVAEVNLGTGLSRQGQYTRAGGCTNLYCHGNGQGDNGTVASNAAPMTCTSCHAGMSSGAGGWNQMSGAHALHLGQAGVTCGNCHSKVTHDGVTVIAPALHVNGVRDVDPVADMPGETAVVFSASAETCTGTCHGHVHTTSGWQSGGSASGRYHPLDFATASVHGAEMELGRQDCRSCHGQTLTGGSYGSVTTPSCDSCHGTATTHTAWRTNCTYCHGGALNQTGAPPRDLGAQPMTVSQSFVAHPQHVTRGIAKAFDCTQCHVKPTDVLSVGHAFDATAGKAEVTLAGGLSAAGVYTAGKCTNLYCHGNGQGDNGTYTDASAAVTCASCHAGMSSGSTGWSTMSGSHRKHLGMSGVTCGDCHNTVTTNGTTIANPDLHIDKIKQTSFPSGIVFNASTKRCTGSCHGQNHNETW